MIRVNLSISAFGPEAANAAELQEKLKRIMDEYGLAGELKGQNFDQFASLFGAFTNTSPSTPSTPSTNE